MELAHSIGADHISHVYGVLHEKIGEKLTEMDNIIVDIIKKMDNNTIILIMGDHGMTDDGSHGGGNPAETDTVIAAYCKKGFRKYKEVGIEGIMRSIDETTEQLIQMDLTPTLSMLLGIPVPIGNIGHIINDLYIEDEELYANETSFLQHIVKENYFSFSQTKDYLSSLQNKKDRFPRIEYKELMQTFDDIAQSYKSYIHMLAAEPNDFKKIKEDSIDLTKKMQETLTEVYKLVKSSSSYDYFLMISGLFILILLVIFFLFFIQYLQTLLKSDYVLSVWNPDITLSQMFERFKSYKLINFVLLSLLFGTSISIESGMIKVATVFIIGLMLFLNWNIIKLSIKSTQSMLIPYKDKPVTHVNVFRRLFIFEDPLLGILTIFIITCGVVARLSVALTRNESRVLNF